VSGEVEFLKEVLVTVTLGGLFEIASESGRVVFVVVESVIEKG
jgi:hypothetical protein